MKRTTASSEPPFPEDMGGNDGKNNRHVSGETQSRRPSYKLENQTRKITAISLVGNSPVGK